MVGGREKSMFTGIIIDVAEVAAVRGAAYGARLSVRPSRPLNVKISDSVSINGVCLTAADVSADLISFDCVRETLDRSTLASLKPGRRVNLELALCAGDPLGGHFVQGHVDCVGRVASLVREEAGRSLRIECPSDVLQMTVEKGSVAVDGVSLTVASVDDRSFTLKIVPYTWEATNFRDRVVGDEVNVETDILARYARRFLSAGQDGSGLTLEKLRSAGF